MCAKLISRILKLKFNIYLTNYIISPLFYIYKNSEGYYGTSMSTIYIQLSCTRCEVVTTSGRSLWAVSDDVTPVAELGLHAFTPLFTLPKL